MKSVTILIMAGGTGGHIFPALAVAECLQKQGATVQWLGSAVGPEAVRIPLAGYPFHAIRVRGLRGNGLLGWLLAPMRIVLAMWAAVKVLHKVQPQVVLGMGGYVSGPGALAAWMLRYPLVIHEQNAIPGLTNKLLSHVASQVLEAFPGSFQPRVGARHTGNPVRAEITTIPAPEQRMEGRRGPVRLLVLGGSQGAKFLNELMPSTLKVLAGAENFEIRHQAGANQIVAARKAYQAIGSTVEPVAFYESMAQQYAWADLVLCRSGAMTVAELAAAGVAAILVPLPYAVDDHQSANGRYLSEAGAALLMPQKQLTSTRLASLLLDFARNRKRLMEMAVRARNLVAPNADRRVAVCCLKWAGVLQPHTEVPHA